MMNDKFFMNFVLSVCSAALLAGCGSGTEENSAAPANIPTASSLNNDEAEIQKNIEKSDSTATETGKTETKPESEPKSEPESKPTEPAKNETVIPKDLGAGKPESKPASDSADAVKLQPVKWADFQKLTVPGEGKKFTLVDAWATWCAPCKENFPHVVEMDEKYAAKGLKVISLSLDDPSDAAAVKEATAFLTSKKAHFTNLLLDEESDVSFDKLNIQAIPAVFLFDASGKEIKRFSLEDPNNLFTYEQVEQTIVAILDGKPLPEFKKAESTEKPKEESK